MATLKQVQGDNRLEIFFSMCMVKSQEDIVITPSPMGEGWEGANYKKQI